MSNQPQTVIHIQNEGSNGVGIAGLIFSILGWFTCGLLCIPGALLSLLALFSTKPKGTAIAGLIVGFPGVLFFVFVGAGMVMAFLGMGVAVKSASDELARKQAEMRNTATQTQEQYSTDTPIEEVASQESTVEKIKSDPLPESPQLVTEPPIESPQPTPEPLPMVAEEKPLRRVFSDQSGKFRVDATVIGFKTGWLRLRRKDGKGDISVEVAKLSEADQSWVEENTEKLTTTTAQK